MVDQAKRRINPFYVLLVLAGVAFAVTACAYGVMAVKQLHASQAPLTGLPAVEVAGAELTSDRRFVAFMDRYGVTLMLAELGLLGFTTVAAIGTDRWWSGGGA